VARAYIAQSQVGTESNSTWDVQDDNSDRRKKAWAFPVARQSLGQYRDNVNLTHDCD